mmetsp:Transcript_28248/g.63069  ORF Transcript_28248/g.63069 Transcript_28248/m.63069 type:complete len:535 (-) Transcript_28248:168-1772(-)|eukprot:CAMPEP_0172599242 /NCGR_PEP_ID=MMETSP1068-20121228/19311_1 /TAXON_ID=35684 /ORGANISM="Pseudopedinella elastica, Strain CCMP716" /LENGTH=534 /DNA_ID=CAMNT_0013399419 /DNA_START=1 /DNA_END=1605 /DNA_ORIENTATION=+
MFTSKVIERRYFFLFVASLLLKSVSAKKRPSDAAPKPAVPWCRKAHVMVPVQDATVVTQPDNEVKLEQQVLVWGGKGHDKAQKAHGSSLLGDVWSARFNLDPPANSDTPLPHAHWDLHAQDESSAPTPRWKSDGDVLGGYFWIFGGDDYSKGHFLKDVWALPISQALEQEDDSNPGVAWTQVKIAKDSPTPHSRRGMAVVALHDTKSLIIIGGRQKHESCLPDSWMLKLPDGWDDPALGPDAWGEAQWSELPELPSACRWGHAATRVVDSITNTELAAVFGGRKLNHATGAFEYNDELWFFQPGTQGGSWTQAKNYGSYSPNPRDHTSLTFDANTHSLYVFGGRTQASLNKPALRDLWKYSLQTESWTELHPSGRQPQTRYLHYAASLRGGMAMFGGEHIDQANEGMHESAKRDTKLNDLWFYEYEHNRWTSLSNKDCEAVDESLPKGANMFELMLLFTIVGVGVAFLLAMASHFHSPGGGSSVFDYCRPRLQRPPGGGGGGPSSPRRLGVELSNLTSSAVSEVTHKSGYERII